MFEQVEVFRAGTFKFEKNPDYFEIKKSLVKHLPKDAALEVKKGGKKKRK